MTLEEAQQIAFIAGTADGGCSHCVGSLCKLLNARFPAFVWVAGDRVNMPDDYPDEEPWFSRIEVIVRRREEETQDKGSLPSSESPDQNKGESTQYCTLQTNPDSWYEDLKRGADCQAL